MDGMEGDMEETPEGMMDMEGEMMGSEEGMEGEYGDEGESPGRDMDDEDMDGDLNVDDNPAFANLPPLDKLRKIRRDIINSINEYRGSFGQGSVFMDILSNRAANEYAEYLLSAEEDE